MRESYCRYERFLTAYADGELRPAARRRVERHLASCPGCAQELDSIRASDRITKATSAPAVSPERWQVFRRELSASLDRVDREAVRPALVREALPVYGNARRRTFAWAGAGAVAVLAVLLLGPLDGIRRRGPLSADGNECIVRSIETHAAGYTPMSFTSGDPEMTVIWVFAEDAGGVFAADGAVTR